MIYGQTTFIFLLFFKILLAEILYIDFSALNGSNSNVFRNLDEAFLYLKNESETNITLQFLSNYTLSEQIFLKGDMAFSA